MIEPGAIAGILDQGALPAKAVIIEDLVRPDQEEPLLHLYNQIAECGGSLLLISEVPPARWPLQLPDLSSRLRATPVAEIGSPDDALLEALLVKMFTDRQLRVGPEVIAFLLLRMERSFAGARGLVARLDGAALSQQRTITVPLARAIFQEDDAPNS